MGHWTSVNGGTPVYVQGPNYESKPFTLQELENLRRTGRPDGGTARADSARKPELKQIVKTHPYTGVRMFEFVGDKSVWMDQFKSVAYEGELNKEEDLTIESVRNTKRKFAERVANRSK
jgi:hypothetical protein